LVDKKKGRKDRPKPTEPYKDELARSAIRTFVKLNVFVDLAVVLLFARDIRDLPEKAPKTKVAVNSIVQSLVVFGISYVFNDAFGEIASGLLVLFLALFLIERGADWLDKKLKKLDKWLTKKGLL